MTTKLTTADRLVHHGIDREEAEAFIADHGEARAVAWLRTCKTCKGDLGPESPCVPKIRA